MGVFDQLKDKGPTLALALLAAKQGGPQAEAAFLQGLQQRRQMDEQRQRQGLLDQQSADLHRAQMDNLAADNQRGDEQLQMQKLQRVLAMIDQATKVQTESAADPVQAENQIMKTAAAGAGAMGMAPDALTGMVPNMAPVISGRQKKQASDLLENLEKQKVYAGMIGTPEFENLTVNFAGKQTPVSELRRMAGTALQTESGAAPSVKKAMQLIDLGDRKMAIDPTQLQHGQTFQESAPAGRDESGALVAIMGPDGAPVLVPRSQAVGKRPASTREQGRPVMSSDANRITDLDTALNDLNRLEQSIGTTGAASKGGAMLPNVVTEYTGWGENAKQRQAVIDQVKQVIGKSLEGGVLRKEDEYKYVKILPTIGDPPPVAKEKITKLRQAIEQRRVITLENLKDANFDTSKFEQRGAKADPLNIR